MENDLNDVMNNNPRKKWTDEQKHKQRLKIAQEHQNGLLYHSLQPLLQFIADVLHPLLRYAVTAMLKFVILMWCLWSWKLTEVVNVLSNFGMFVNDTAFFS